MALQEMMEHFFHLYGRRNRIFLSSLRKRVDFLYLAIGDLQEVVRKEMGGKHVEVALARVISRIFCIAENFQNLPLVEMMARKYPAQRCGYCKKFPCACTERRPDVHLEEVATKEQQQWSLKEWCLHFARMYGAKNKEKGIENVLNRLFKEVSEISSLSMNIPNMRSMDEIEQEFALELSDALAWTAAVATILETDLEKAVLDRFGNSCWNCRKNPCICSHFNVTPVPWDKVVHAS